MLIMCLGTVVAAVGQVFLKKAALADYKSKIGEYLNVRVIVGYGLFLLSTVFSTWGLRYMPLALSPAVEGFSQFITTILSHIVFKETITKKKMLGMAFIIVGTILVCLR